MNLFGFRINRGILEFSLIMAVFISALVAFLPNYDRLLYPQTEPVKYLWSEYNTGYPAGEDVPELASREEILKERHGYTLVVDARNIKPLHLYLGLHNDILSESAFSRFWDKLEEKKASGQFYSVVLENGDTMIVLLDDHAVKLPRNGKVKLPIGKTEKTWKALRETLAEKGDFSEEELAYYIDMASDWRRSDVAKKIEGVRGSVSIITLLIVPFGAYYLMVRMERMERKRAEDRRKYG